ncbi:uncharacterized protein LOC116197629 [Punica granatum]|uniref:Uncharacterized protein LOC116197629 n=1 Tax=Punica granatum TaxID=22663 RepID=A0A6P8CW21_PUNGR|nr:uncharacterized protein LOC116197629 [Punica granatum]
MAERNSSCPPACGEIEKKTDESFQHDLPPEGWRYLTDEEWDRYQRQVAETDGFDVDHFSDYVYAYMIRPVPLECVSKEKEATLKCLIDKAVEHYNACSNLHD